MTKTKTKTVRRVKPKYQGYTEQELQDLSLSELTQIAKLEELEKGTEIHFNFFHFLRKPLAIKLLVIGDNSNPIAKKIVAAKTAEMDAALPKAQVALRAKRQAARARKEILAIKFKKQLASQVKLVKGVPSAKSLAPKLQKEALKAYYEMKTV